MVTLIVFLSILSTVCFVIGGLILLEGQSINSTVFGIIFCLFGFLFLALFILQTHDLGAKEQAAFGQPQTEIAAGSYKVGFVYEAGDRVSVGVEIKKVVKESSNSIVDSISEEKLYFYQFPKSAFAGEVKRDASRLVVTERSGFKKLELQ